MMCTSNWPSVHQTTSWRCPVITRRTTRHMVGRRGEAFSSCVVHYASSARGYQAVLVPPTVLTTFHRRHARTAIVFTHSAADLHWPELGVGLLKITWKKNSMQLHHQLLITCIDLLLHLSIPSCSLSLPDNTLCQRPGDQNPHTGADLLLSSLVSTALLIPSMNSTATRVSCSTSASGR